MICGSLSYCKLRINDLDGDSLDFYVGGNLTYRQFNLRFEYSTWHRHNLIGDRVPRLIHFLSYEKDILTELTVNMN